MRYSKVVLQLIAAGAVASVLVYALRFRDGGQPPSSERKREVVTEAPRSEALGKEVEALRRELRALRAESRAGAAPMPSSVSPAAATASAEGDAPPEPPSEEEVAKIVQQRFTELDDAFRSQPPNSDWGSRKQGELTETFAASTLAAVEDIECRAAMCRVQTQHSSHEEADRFFDENEWKPGLSRSRVTRLKLDEHRYVYYVRPRDAAPSRPAQATN
jgi:hypothetical protein